MVKCPQCQATLPDGAIHCQFCGTTFASAPPPPRTGLRSALAYSGGTPGWVWPAYYGIAGWWMLNGLYSIVEGLSSGAFGIIGIVLGAVTALIGLGLILRIEAARGIVNVLCFLNILFGVLGIVELFFLAPVTGFAGAIAILRTILNIGLSGLMIFVIGETESRAPNF